METILAKFNSIAEDVYSFLSKYKKEKGFKVVGCLPMYVPEEIIHASGALPVVLQESNEPITIGHSKIQSFFCGIARSIVDSALKGNLDFLDAVVSPEIDLAINGLGNILRANMNINHLTIYQPTTITKRASRGFLSREINIFRSSLENFTGQKITDERLKNSIEIYNKNRRLLRDLYDLRRKNPSILSSVQMRSILMTSMSMLKEEHNQLLENLLPKLKSQKTLANRATKLILSGCLCEAPPPDILNLIEELGGIIVDDDIYTGARYFSADVVIDDSPIDAIVKRQLNMPIPCPTRIDEEIDWGDYVIRLAQDSHARGVIHLVVKYCQPHEMYYPYLSKRLSSAGIPDLKLEIEHEMMSIASTKTRIQAFIEILNKNGGR
jgi:benzoyl-CoA reductase subunit C